MTPQEWDRLRWQCRRGMLELDVILLPFMEQSLPAQSDAVQADFVHLLEHSDLQLFRWLMRGESPVEPALAALITLIRDEHRARQPG